MEAVHLSRCPTAIFPVTLPNPFVLVRKAARATNRLALIAYAYHMDQFLVCCQVFCAKPALPGESHLCCACKQKKKGGKNPTELCSWQVMENCHDMLSWFQGNGILDRALNVFPPPPWCFNSSSLSLFVWSLFQKGLQDFCWRDILVWSVY